MQATSDIFLGWDRVTGADGIDRDFDTLQLRDWKFSFPIERMIPKGMDLYAQHSARGRWPEPMRAPVIASP